MADYNNGFIVPLPETMNVNSGILTAEDKLYKMIGIIPIKSTITAIEATQELENHIFSNHGIREKLFLIEIKYL